jgi:GNAT superfamily N-acetyltransferase
MAVEVTQTRPEHFERIIEICHAVYPDSPAWDPDQLASHVEVFPEGQLTAVEIDSGRAVGMAASLVVLWDDYEFDHTWREITGDGYFTTHDPQNGHTLYGAEIMVDPVFQGMGVGGRIYEARRALVQRRGLLRIRAGARLAGYLDHADEMGPEEYVVRVIRGQMRDPTLSFQLRQGFHVLAVTDRYLMKDPASQGHAAVIEWINEEVARPGDYAGRDPKFEPVDG